MLHIMASIDLLVVYLCLISALGANEQDWFHSAIQIHGDVCPPTEQCCAYCERFGDCAKHGSCCLDQFDSFESARLAMKDSFQCVKMQYFLNKDPKHQLPTTFLGVDEVWLIGQCGGETDESVRCSSPGPDDFLEFLAPVTDVGTNTTYKNKNCAFCSGIQESQQLKNWDMEISCDGNLDITVDDLYSQMKEKDCSVFFRSPENVQIETCWMPEYTIANCNTTGSWTSYDPFLEQACHSFVDPFNSTFQNYFCYLCNIDEPVAREDWVCPYLGEPVKEIMPPFIALIDLDAANDWENDDHLDCNMVNQFEDRKMMVCRDIQCYEKIQLVGQVGHDHACTPLDRKFSGLCFLVNVFVKLTPLKTRLRLNDVYLVNRIIYFMKVSLDEYEYIEDFQFYKKLIYQGSKSFVEYLAAHIVIHIEYLHWNNLATFLLHFHNKSIPVDHLDFNLKIASLGITKDLLLIEVYKDNKTLENACSERHELHFNKVLLCPFIKINMNETSMKIENESLVFEETTPYKMIAPWQYEVHDETIHICLDDYRSVYDALPWSESNNYVREEETITISQILSLTCTCVSLVCLLITIGFYMMRPQLRTQPGINNIILCVSLLLAQSFYQFGAGQAAYVSSVACSIIGGSCHFFWLCVIFSMNSCSIQMFKVFKSNVLMSPQLSWMATVKNILYVICFSLVFVIVNLTISLSVSKGMSSGYEGPLCFLSDYLMHLVTFMVPTAVTIVVNGTLFAYVVFIISKTSSNVVMFRQERNYFAVYIRLSTLTGLTWVFGYIHLFVDYTILEYLFIIFNSCQGVFIMLAFVVKPENCFNILRCFSRGKDASMAS